MGWTTEVVDSSASNNTPRPKNKALFIEGFFMPVGNIILDSVVPLDRAGTLGIWICARGA